MIATVLILASWAGLTTWITEMGVFLTALTVTLGLMAGVKKAFVALGLGKPFAWIWRTLAGDHINTWFGAELAKQLDPLKKELQTNGGTSLKDAVNRTEKAVNELSIKAESMEQRLTKLETDNR